MVVKSRDRSSGRSPISRREALGFLGAAGVTAVVGCGGSSDGSVGFPTPTPLPSPTPTPGELDCVLTPEQTEGPYFLDDRLNRADITTDVDTGVESKGQPLLLRLGAYGVDGPTCLPLAGGTIDVWHADAAGQYSGFDGELGKTFLRGYQVADENGLVEIKTIFPGWYPGRTVHIHVKVRFFDESGDASFERTTQLYFHDDFADLILREDPYNTRGERVVRNADDAIFGDGGKDLTFLSVTPNEVEGGYIAVYSLGLLRP